MLQCYHSESFVVCPVLVCSCFPVASSYHILSIVEQPKSHPLTSTRNVQHSPAMVVNRVRKHLTVN